MFGLEEECGNSFYRRLISRICVNGGWGNVLNFPEKHGNLFNPLGYNYKCQKSHQIGSKTSLFAWFCKSLGITPKKLKKCFRLCDLHFWPKGISDIPFWKAMTFPLRVTSMIWHLEVPKINKSSKKFEKTKLCEIQTSADFNFLKKA